MKLSKVRVRLSRRSYEVIIGSGVVGSIQSIKLPSKNAFIIADRSLVGPRRVMKGMLRSRGWKINEIAVQGGEAFKDFKKVYPIYGQLLKLRARRDSVIFALGGGSIGDAAGFIASTYLRGIPWVCVPTTLLAQVDSAIGGKTAVNHAVGKNLIGSFYQPAAVLCEMEFLKTLSRREMVSGLGEALKYGLVFDRKFFQYMVSSWDSALLQDPKVLHYIVQKSAKYKALIVEKDEFDHRGSREFLNFGHTFAHALERFTSYKRFQHGEAVIWGMRFALALSFLKHHLSQKDFAYADGFLSRIQVPTLPSGLQAKTLVDLMFNDKKFRHGKLFFVLLKNLGQPFSASNINSMDVKHALELIR